MIIGKGGGATATWLTAEQSSRSPIVLLLVVSDNHPHEVEDDEERGRGSRNPLVFELILQGVHIHRERIAPPWRLELRLIHSFEVTREIAAAALHLRRFEPVHVIVNLAHPRGELLTSDVETRQTLWYSPPFSAG